MAIKNKYSDIDLSKYSSGYTASKDVLNAQKLKTQAEEAVKNYGDFNYKNQAAYDDAMNAILNRKGFTYDVNGDALYQQYKDNYMRQGKLAMQDTMAQAASLTGGYGNSYATSVGNQAYQGYLAQLNDVIPELYNLALNAYNAEDDRIKSNYSLLESDRNAEYAMYNDKYNKLAADRSYYSDNYNNAYTQDYSKWTDNRNYDTSQYWNEYNAGYQAERDAIADARAASAANYEAKIAALEAKYAGYLSPEMQKAANSDAVKTFQGSIFKESELAKRSYSAKVGDTTKRFDNYAQYVDAVAEKWSKEGRLTENEIAYIKGYYGIE